MSAQQLDFAAAAPPPESAPPDPVAELLARDDAGLGAGVVSLMSWGPTPEAFAALGRMVRGATRADVEALVRRKGKRR